MIQSPCRDCRNRHMDKKRCADSCDRLKRVQLFHAAQMEPARYSAVNSQDEGRYRLAVLSEGRIPILSEFAT